MEQSAKRFKPTRQKQRVVISKLSFGYADTKDTVDKKCSLNVAKIALKKIFLNRTDEDLDRPTGGVASGL